MRVQIPASQPPFFFSFIVFLPFGFLLFILTADPFSFARFLRKRISSYEINSNPPSLFASGLFSLARVDDTISFHNALIKGGL